MTTPTDYRAALAEIADLLSQATDPDDLGIRAGQAIARARALLAAPEAAPVLEDWFFEFEKWLVTQMPAGTVISDPRWWAPRIARACTSRFTAAPEAVNATPSSLRFTAAEIRAANGMSAPEAVGVTVSVKDTVNGLMEIAGSLTFLEKHSWAQELVEAAAVLSRYAHPAPVPVGDAVTAQRDRLLMAVEWALGTSPDGFEPPESAHGRYWWRKELAERCGITWDGERWVEALPLPGVGP